jgi:ribosome maturation factor RimP
MRQREGSARVKLDPQIVEQLAAVAADEGLELLAAEMVGSGPKAALRLVVDGPDGVTLDHCSSVSRQASALLDLEDPIGHAYTLEVTSPGLDRKLYSPGDFSRFAGRRVKLRMKPDCREHRVALGELLGLDGETVLVRDDDKGPIELPLEQVFEARLEVDWDAVMKEGKNRP